MQQKVGVGPDGLAGEFRPGRILSGDELRDVAGGTAGLGKQLLAAQHDRHPRLGPRRYRQVAGVEDDEIEQFARYRSEEHTSELQSLMRISYDVFCWKKKKKQQNR